MPVEFRMPPHSSPLVIMFTVLDAQAAAMGGERVAFELFAERLARYLGGRGVEAGRQVVERAVVFTAPRGVILAAAEVSFVLANLPPDNARAQFELHTLPGASFADLPTAQQWTLGKFHEELTQLVIAWQETEDVDACQLAAFTPDDAHVYGHIAPPKPTQG